MLFLASSSPTRAKLLKEAGFDFIQLNIQYDESKICTKNTLAHLYTSAVVNEKYIQFIQQFNINEFLNKGSILFADSSVICNNKIFGKAKNEDEALEMLNLQSANKVCVYTAMKVINSNFCLDSLDATCFEFKEFNQNELKKYLKSKQWQGKAGAMMIEGFNGLYIKSQNGYKSIAMGLNTQTLQAFCKKI